MRWGEINSGSSRYGGRPCDFELAQQLCLVDLVKDACANHSPLSGHDIAQVSQVGYVAQATATGRKINRVPVCGVHFRRDINRRIPGAMLRARVITPQEVNRIEAITPRSIYSIAMNIKNWMIENHNKEIETPTFISSRRIIVADEVGFGADDKSSGKRCFSVLNRAVESKLGQNDGHTTITRYMRLNGSKLLNVIVRQGKLQSQVVGPEPRSFQANLTFTETGSVLSSQEINKIGSFAAQISDLIKKVNEEGGVFPTARSWRLLLIIDGTPPHNCAVASQLLRDCGIDLMMLTPFTTSVSQISDDGLLNGSFTIMRREFVRYCQAQTKKSKLDSSLVY
jgi:hypothetical protein